MADNISPAASTANKSRLVGSAPVANMTSGNKTSTEMHSTGQAQHQSSNTDSPSSMFVNAIEMGKSALYENAAKQRQSRIDREAEKLQEAKEIRKGLDEAQGYYARKEELSRLKAGDLGTKLLQELKEQVIGRFEQEHRTNIRDNIYRQRPAIQAEITTRIEMDVRQQLRTDLEPEVMAKLAADLHDSIEEMLYVTMKPKIEQQLREEMRAEMRAEMQQILAQDLAAARKAEEQRKQAAEQERAANEKLILAQELAAHKAEEQRKQAAEAESAANDKLINGLPKETEVGNAEAGHEVLTAVEIPAPVQLAQETKTKHDILAQETVTAVEIPTPQKPSHFNSNVNGAMDDKPGLPNGVAASSDIDDLPDYEDDEVLEAEQREAEEEAESLRAQNAFLDSITNDLIKNAQNSIEEVKDSQATSDAAPTPTHHAAQVQLEIKTEPFPSLNGSLTMPQQSPVQFSDPTGYRNRKRSFDSDGSSEDDVDRAYKRVRQTTHTQELKESKPASPLHAKRSADEISDPQPYERGPKRLRRSQKGPFYDEDDESEVDTNGHHEDGYAFDAEGESVEDDTGYDGQNLNGGTIEYEGQSEYYEEEQPFEEEGDFQAEALVGQDEGLEGEFNESGSYEEEEDDEEGSYEEEEGYDDYETAATGGFATHQPQSFITETNTQETAFVIDDSDDEEEAAAPGSHGRADGAGDEEEEEDLEDGDQGDEDYEEDPERTLVGNQSFTAINKGEEYIDGRFIDEQEVAEV